ncbi:MAG: FGGY family carbohydrate kinase [Actinomycetaceae bacterium]|nr:FGGY family carbohydrate kinase [Actinomycetaceae bacterium]
MSSLYLGVDVGTSSTKGVIVDSQGNLLAQAVRQHKVDNPKPGFFEMDARIWWEEFTSITQELCAAPDVTSNKIRAVGTSGMGPCVGIADEDMNPLAPTILYGVDSRATQEIEELNAAFGEDTIYDIGGSYLSSQAGGPKFRWLANNNPQAFEAARRFFMPATYLAYQLTGQYVMDHQSASQLDPLYDLGNKTWNRQYCRAVLGNMETPELRWGNEQAGTVTTQAARETGLPQGIPVITGTIDAWAEGVSADAVNPGDLMLMYGTTLFLICTGQKRMSYPSLWGTAGVCPDTFSLAGGMATSGAITNWLEELCGGPGFEALTREAGASKAGAGGLLCLPYFAGERTPIADPQARGTLTGLTLSTTRGDLYRAVLEGTAFGVAHNIEAFESAGARIERLVAVGGGTKGGLWTEIVSSVTGKVQVIPKYSIGASYGDAFMAAAAVEGLDAVDMARWNPPARVIEPDPSLQGLYQEMFARYRELYEQTKGVQHYLASL